MGEAEKEAGTAMAVLTRTGGATTLRKGLVGLLLLWRG